MRQFAHLLLFLVMCVPAAAAPGAAVQSSPKAEADVARLMKERDELLEQLKRQVAALPTLPPQSASEPQAIFDERARQARMRMVLAEIERRIGEERGSSLASGQPVGAPGRAYYQRIRMRVEEAEAADFPVAPDGQRIYGTVAVSFTIDAQGQLRSVEISRTDRPELATHVESLLRRLAPFEAFPSDLAASVDQVVVNIAFRYAPADPGATNGHPACSDEALTAASATEPLRALVRQCDGALKVSAWRKLHALPGPAPTVQFVPREWPQGKVGRKVTFSTNAFFYQGEGVLLPLAATYLDKFLKTLKASGCALEVIIVVGLDEPESTADMKVGTLRTESTRRFFVAAGIPARRVYTESKELPESERTLDDLQAAAFSRRVEVQAVMRGPAPIGTSSTGCGADESTTR